MKYKVFLLAALTVTVLSGCEMINMTRAAGLMADYNLLATGASVFNSQDGSQYLIPPPHESTKDKMLVCYTNEGLFSDTDEKPLRDAANEWLQQNKPYMVAGAGENRSGVWESRTCYEFQYGEQVQPIGAYLDENTGEVVIVGETNTGSVSAEAE